MQYDFHDRLKALWDEAVRRYKSGNEDPNRLFSDGELHFIAQMGATAREVFDFIEDHVKYGEPDFAFFASLADIRYHYFLRRQKGRRSPYLLVNESLPAKTDAVHGVEWLPRLIPKALAKLRGELNPDIMYGCGGDRAFFKKWDVHPAEFLRIVEEHEQDPDAVVQWFLQRTGRKAAAAKAAP